MLKIRTETVSDGMSGAVGIAPSYYNNRRIRLVIEGTVNEMAGLEINIPTQPDKEDSKIVGVQLGGHRELLYKDAKASEGQGGENKA